jgi:early secretory antigenic target protein ESAT-6
MSDGLLKVNFVALSEAGSDIKAAVAELDARLGQLKTDAVPLVEQWEGAAQAAYYARQDRWTKASDDLKAILQEIQIAVEKSAHDYAATESNAEKRFS